MSLSFTAQAPKYPPRNIYKCLELTASSVLDQGSEGLVLPLRGWRPRVSPTLAANVLTPLCAVTPSSGNRWQDVHDYQSVKPDLFDRLISYQRNQDRHIPSGAGISGFKTRDFTPSYIITT